MGSPGVMPDTPMKKSMITTALDDAETQDTESTSSSESDSDSDEISEYEESDIAAEDEEAALLEDVNKIPRKSRIVVFIIMWITQLVANFDSGALASIYGMKPVGQNVACAVGSATFTCPATEADGTTYPPTTVSPGVTAYLTAEESLNGTAAEWLCAQSGDVVNCAFGTASWTCDRVVGTYNTEVTAANYSCVYAVGDNLAQSLLHDPDFNDLYTNKNLQGFLSSIVYLGISVGAIATGVALRFFRAQRILLLSLVGNVGFCALFSLSFDRVSLFLSRFLVGVTQATLLVYAPVWVSEFALPEYSSLWMSLIQAAVPLGIVLGYMTAGGIAAATTLEWPWSFYIQCIALTPCVIVMFCIPSYLINVGEGYPPDQEEEEETPTEMKEVSCHSSESVKRSVPAKMGMPPMRMSSLKGGRSPQEDALSEPRSSGLGRRASSRFKGKDEEESRRKKRIQLGALPLQRNEPVDANDESSQHIRRVNTPRDDNASSAGLSDSAATESNKPMSEMEALKAVLKNPIVWLGIATTTSLYFVVTAMQLWITDYLTTEPLPVNIPGTTSDDRYTTIVMSFGVTAITAPITGVLVGGFVLDSKRCIGGVAEHPNKAALFSTLAGFGATGCAFSALIQTEFWPFIVSIWFTLCFGGMVLPGFIGVIFAAVPVELRDITSSLAGLMWNLFGYFAGPWLTGVVADSVSLQWGFRLALGWSAVAAFFGVLTWIVGVRQKLKRGGNVGDVYCMTIAVCLGYKVEEVEQVEEDMDVCAVVEQDGELSLVPYPGDRAEIGPLVKLMLLLAEYAEDDALIRATSHNSILNRRSARNLLALKDSSISKSGILAVPEVMIEGEAELLHEIFVLIDTNRDGIINQEDIEDFLREHRKLAAKLRGVAGLEDEVSIMKMSQHMFATLSVGAADPREITWDDMSENGGTLLALLSEWRNARLKPYFVLTGFANRSDKRIFLKRASHRGLHYYYGPADPDNEDETKDKAQIFLYTVSRRGRRCWTIGTPRDFATKQSGYFYADCKNNYGLLTSPHRQSVWHFSNSLAEENQWGCTLRVTTRDLWEIERATYEREDRRLLGQPGGAFGMAALGVKIAGPLTTRPAEKRTPLQSETHRDSTPMSPTMTQRRSGRMGSGRLTAGWGTNESMVTSRGVAGMSARHGFPTARRGTDTSRRGTDPMQRLDTFRRLESGRRFDHRQEARNAAPQHMEYFQDGLLMLTPSALLKKLRKALNDNAVTMKHTDDDLVKVLQLEKNAFSSMYLPNSPAHSPRSAGLAQGQNLFLGHRSKSNLKSAKASPVPSLQQEAANSKLKQSLRDDSSDKKASSMNSTVGNFATTQPAENLPLVAMVEKGEDGEALEEQDFPDRQATQAQDHDERRAAAGSAGGSGGTGVPRQHALSRSFDDDPETPLNMPNLRTPQQQTPLTALHINLPSHPPSNAPDSAP